MNDQPSDRPPADAPVPEVEESGDADGSRDAAASPGTAEPTFAEDAGPRPWLERIGMAGIAVVMSLLFATLAVAAGSGGEWILAPLPGQGIDGPTDELRLIR